MFWKNMKGIGTWGTKRVTKHGTESWWSQLNTHFMDQVEHTERVLIKKKPKEHEDRYKCKTNQGLNKLVSMVKKVTYQ